MRQQSGIQVCMESERNIESCQYTIGQTYHSKRFESIHNFNTRIGIFYKLVYCLFK